MPNLKENSAIYKTVFPFGAPESYLVILYHLGLENCWSFKSS